MEEPHTPDVESPTDAQVPDAPRYHHVSPPAGPPPVKRVRIADGELPAGEEPDDPRRKSPTWWSVVHLKSAPPEKIAEFIAVTPLKEIDEAAATLSNYSAFAAYVLRAKRCMDEVVKAAKK